ncbi:phosphotyrosyl phosphatase activator [Xylariaceae sp. FL1272]|nr:phosphotyrosyl phosphatase activator [Xylariaceae sp. FL1272]
MEPPPPAMMQTAFPALERLDAGVSHDFVKPVKQIHDADDVSKFLTSKAYRDIGLFVMQLNRAMCPRKVTGPDGKDKFRTFLIGSDYETKPVHSIHALQTLLAKIESLIDEAPPLEGPRRFGNVAFRTWYAKLEEHVESFLKDSIPESIHGFGSNGSRSEVTALDELAAYLLGSFGSAQRLDYGTGHELSFLAFLGSLWKLGVFKNEDAKGDIERSIVLGVFEPYLRVVRRLILTYTLEPAGSHGVWGLDDHSFQPYIYGSAQLTRAITESDPMPLEGSLFRAPKPSMVTNAEYVDEERKKNLYFSAIGFINDVKKGPFWEHSPILFDISGIKDGWGKINKGMIKMFNAEVLSKFPVVQHFPFGSLYSWDQDPDAQPPQLSVHMANQHIASSSMPPPGAALGGTAAPWAKTTSMPPPMGPGTRFVRAPPSAQPSQGATQRPQPPQQPHPVNNASTFTRTPWTQSSDRPSG